jgi:serine/threonine-protein kinase SRK2
MGNCLGGGGGGGANGGGARPGTTGGGGATSGGLPPAASSGNRSGVAPTQAAHGSGPPDFGLGDQYEVLHLLGTGGEGETWLCRERASGRELAVKLVARPIPKSITQIIQREIKILADLGDGHLNIVHAEEVVLTPTHVGLVMEYVRGGNMVSFVTSRRETRDQRGGLCIQEEEAAFFFRQLVWAVRFCHSNHVAHRDLKLDNTLLDGRDPPRLKLCDFGFAKSWSASPNMDTMRIGTPEYMAPDLISGRSGYDGKKVDVWASGVLLFVMLLGMFPFEMDDDNYVNTAGLYSIWIQQVRTSWQEAPANAGAVARLSPECRDLLDRMFDVNQETRIGVEEIVAHPWFTRPLPDKYERALEVLRADQAAIDARLAAAAAQGPGRSRERDAALHDLLDKATRPPGPEEQAGGPRAVVRVPLTRYASAMVGAAGGGGGGGGLPPGAAMAGGAAAGPLGAIAEGPPPAAAGGATATTPDGLVGAATEPVVAAAAPPPPPAPAAPAPVVEAAAPAVAVAAPAPPAPAVAAVPAAAPTVVAAAPAPPVVAAAPAPPVVAAAPPAPPPPPPPPPPAAAPAAPPALPMA